LLSGEHYRSDDTNLRRSPFSEMRKCTSTDKL
jgi:hypothetical protein